MSKKTAVLAVNPVNGAGLFQYLEAFYENGIPYEVFAVAPTKGISTNSGIAFSADDTIASLKGRVDDFYALVFACGDAMPKFGETAGEPYNQDLLAVVKAFGEKGKIMIGHCVGGLIFDLAGVAAGKKLAVHPLVKGAVQTATATDADFEADGNFITARTENAIGAAIGKIVETLR